MPGIRIRKRLTVPRRSTPPEEEPPKTWTQIIFFPLSWIALASMAAMLLIYLWMTRMVEPVDEAHEDLLQPPTMPLAIQLSFPTRITVFPWNLRHPPAGLSLRSNRGG